MGQVALTLNVMLESPDVDVDVVKKEIEKQLQPEQIVEKPIAFGLKMLEVLLVFDDREGANTDAIEEKLRSIEGVASVEAGDVTLI
ncbi:MAG: elongation factor 1-beta [Candidatus Aenigmarchaeota archaeon]|nr:elongation factor 1-beta [Candidatus Aenigmarchaeota archaeon]